MKDVKRKLRQEVFAEIDALPEEYIRLSDQGIFEHVREIPEYQKAKTIFFYYSTGREPDTRKLMEEALKEGKCVTIPKITGRGLMEASVVSSMESLVVGKFDIATTPDGAETIPAEELDLIVVPAVSFDKDGYRLGYGGGYYDRFLIRTKAFSIGLARGKILKEQVPREEHDTRVACLVTEEKIARLK